MLHVELCVRDQFDITPTQQQTKYFFSFHDQQQKYRNIVPISHHLLTYLLPLLVVPSLEVLSYIHCQQFIVNRISYYSLSKLENTNNSKLNFFKNMSTGTEIDEEIANFRAVQEQLQRIRTDLQLVMSQLTENEMVKQELDLLDSSTNIYKMVGPVLIKNSLEDANETVSKRLEFITGEKKRLEGKAKELETRGNAIAMKVQQMQAQLQQVTAAAVQEIQKAATTTN